MTVWERVDPPSPCMSPDGHDLVDVLSPHSHIPIRLICRRCGRDGMVAELPVSGPTYRLDLAD